MRIKKLLTTAQVALIGLSFLALEALSAPLYNPDFDLGLDGWSDASTNGSVVVNAGAATFTAGEGVNPFSAVLVQGDDASFSFLNPIMLPSLTTTLDFDLLFIERLADSSETGTGIFDDIFSLSVYDATDSAYDRVFSGLSFNSMLSHQSLDIGSLAGRNVAFSFELTDEDDGFNLSVAIDNLRILEEIPTTALPESGTLPLIFLGLAALMFARRRQHL
jgi:hypothetical protein